MQKIKVTCGIDNIERVHGELVGNRLGLVTAPSGVDRMLRPSWDILRERYHLTVLMAPEHGLRGAAQAGGHDDNHVDPESGLPVYSLGSGEEYVSPEAMEQLDVLLFDIQDVGARFYTYLYTMTRCMKACAAAGKPFYVLDRMNPIGLRQLEGNILDEQYASFVGEYAVPTRYGLTIGEFARYINTSHRLGCDLHVVPCGNLTRELYFEDTDLQFIPPSPNIPTPQTALTYIGTCIFEATNVSEGRGTTRPFELIGAPYIDGRLLLERMNAHHFEGVLFRRAYFTPTFSKHQGTLCDGIQIHVTDRNLYRPFAVGLYLFQEIRSLFPAFEMLNSGAHLFGDLKLRDEYTSCDRIAAFLAENERRLADFRRESESSWLY